MDVLFAYSLKTLFGSGRLSAAPAETAGHRLFLAESEGQNRISALCGAAFALLPPLNPEYSYADKALYLLRDKMALSAQSRFSRQADFIGVNCPPAVNYGLYSDK